MSPEEKMQSPVEHEFDDPVLKEAVCKCWACDCAPAYLKEKIAELMETPVNISGQSRPKISWMIWPAFLAAAVLLSVGLVFHFRPGTSSLTRLPSSLQVALISRHDSCCSEANHQHLPVDKNDDIAIADALRGRLHQPVLVCRPDDDAWLFKGASVCPVGSTASGHLVFAKGSENLSIFSLPKSILPNAKDGDEFSSTTDQHCIVAFVKDGALFCIVGSDPKNALNVAGLKQMETRMEPLVSVAFSPRIKVPSNGVMLTELLRPTEP